MDTDDPRDILKAAGVECAEVDSWYEPWTYSEEVDVSAASEKAEDAFLALACLVAKHKRQRDAVLSRYVIAVEEEWGISHWKDDDVQPRDDSGYLSDVEAREKWKARVVDDLGKNEWDELHD